MNPLRVLLLLFLSLSLALAACAEKPKKAKKKAAKVTQPAPTPPPAPVCKPACDGKACGDDGCGGDCGACPGDQVCLSNVCAPPPCKPACAGKTCGPDSCGATCGTCPSQTQCRDGRCDPTVALTFDQGRPATAADGLPSALHIESLGFPSDWSGSGTCTYGEFPLDNARQALAANPYSRLLLQLAPNCGLGDYLVDGGSPALQQAAAALADSIKAHPVPVFVAFGPSMNAPWTPWSVCSDENAPPPAPEGAPPGPPPGPQAPLTCTEAPEDFVKAYKTLKTLLAPAGPNLTLVFLANRELDYWKSKTPPLPTFEKYYPGPDITPVLGLFVATEEVLPEGAVQKAVKDFSARLARLGAKDSPLILLGSSECKETERLECLRPVGNFDGTEGWWGPWGNLKTEVRPNPALGACLLAEPGAAHLALSTSDPDGKGEWYVGGFTIPVPEDARDWSAAGALVFWAAAEGNGQLGLQVDLCDGSTTRCPADNPCCKEELWTTLVNLESKTFAPVAIPFDSFQAPSGVDSGPLNLTGVRAVNFHVFRAGPGDGTVLLDALALARLANDNRCANARHSLVSQLLSPALCGQTPPVLAVVLNWAVERKGDSVVDRRLLDRFLLKNLLDAACFSGVW